MAEDNSKNIAEYAIFSRKIAVYKRSGKKVKADQRLGDFGNCFGLKNVDPHASITFDEGRHMIVCGKALKRFDLLYLRVIVFAVAIVAPGFAWGEAGPQDRGYFAMRLPDSEIAALSGQMQPVILPLEEGYYYRYSEGAGGTQYAQGAYSADPLNPPQPSAMLDDRDTRPEWGAYDDWGGWQEYVGR